MSRSLSTSISMNLNKYESTYILLEKTNHNLYANHIVKFNSTIPNTTPPINTGTNYYIFSVNLNTVLVSANPHPHENTDCITVTGNPSGTINIIPNGTITSAVNGTSNKIKFTSSSHGLSTGDPITIHSTNQYPTNVISNKIYYVFIDSGSTNEFYISLSSNPNISDCINYVTQGSGLIHFTTANIESGSTIIESITRINSSAANRYLKFEKTNHSIQNGQMIQFFPTASIPPALNKLYYNNINNNNIYHFENHIYYAEVVDVNNFKVFKDLDRSNTNVNRVQGANANYHGVVTYKQMNYLKIQTLEISSSDIQFTIEGTNNKSFQISTGDKIKFVAISGSLPQGINSSNTYYIIRTGDSTYKVASSFHNSRLGTALESTDSNGAVSGTFYVDILNGIIALKGLSSGSSSKLKFTKTTPHGLSNGDKITLNTTKTLPASLNTTTLFYVFIDGGSIYDFYISSTHSTPVLANCIAYNNSAKGEGIHNFSNHSLVSSFPVARLTTYDNSTPSEFTQTNHGLSEGNKIKIKSTALLPTGLSGSTFYFVRNVTSNTFNLATANSDVTRISITDNNITGILKTVLSANNIASDRIGDAAILTNIENNCTVTNGGTLSNITALNAINDKTTIFYTPDIFILKLLKVDHHLLLFLKIMHQLVHLKLMQANLI